MASTCCNSAFAGGGAAATPMPGYGGVTYASACENLPGQCERGVMQIGVTRHSIDLQMWDEPLTYAPEVGPWLSPRVQYDEMDNRHTVTPGGILNSLQNLQQMNLGPKWSINWLAYVEIPDSPIADGFRYYLPGGGYRQLTWDARRGCASGETGSCFPNAIIEDGIELTKMTTAGLSPSGSGEMLPAGSFYARNQDGSIDEFAAIRVVQTPDTDPSRPARRWGYRAYWTRRIDRLGRSLQLTWEGEHLTRVIDAMGRQTRLEYAADINPSDSAGRRPAALLGRIVDPYGHAAEMVYVDAKWGLDPIFSSLAPQEYRPDPSMPGIIRPPSLWRSEAIMGPVGLRHLYRGNYRLTSIVDAISVRSEIRYHYGFTASAEGRFVAVGNFSEWCSDSESLPPPTTPEAADTYLINIDTSICNAYGAYLRASEDLRFLPHGVVTPYGRTNIQRSDVRRGAQIEKKRWVFTDPAGQMERWEVWYLDEPTYFAPRICPPGGAGSTTCGTLAGTTVPGHWKNWRQVLELDNAFVARPCRDLGEPGTQPVVDGCSKLEISTNDHPYALYLRNVYHWTKKAISEEIQEAQEHGFILDPTLRSQDTVLSLNRAEINHFLLNETEMSPILSATKKPMLSWEYYAYPNQARMAFWDDPLISGVVMQTSPSLTVRQADNGLAVTRITYNAQNNIRSITGPDGTGYSLDYLANGLDVSSVWRVGRSGERVLVSETDYYTDTRAPTDPMRGKPAIWRTRDDAAAETEFHYEAFGRVTGIQNNHHLVRSRIHADRTQALTTTIAYTYPIGITDRIAGNWYETMTAPDGVTKVSIYERGLLREERLGSNTGPVLHRYDYLNAGGSEDGFGRPWLITDERGGETRLMYQNLHLSSITDPLLRHTEIGVDHLMRPIRLELPVAVGGSRIVTITYDPSGNIGTVTTPGGGITTWGYDILGRMVSENKQGVYTKIVGYLSPVGLATQIQFGEGRQQQFEYDVVGHLISKWVRKNGGSNWRQAAYIKYDSLARLESLTDRRGTTNYNYDSIFPLRLASKMVPVGFESESTGLRQISAVVSTQYLHATQGQYYGTQTQGMNAASTVDQTWEYILTDSLGHTTGYESDIANMDMEYRPWNPTATTGASFGELNRRIISLTSIPDGRTTTGQVIQELQFHNQTQGFATSSMAYATNNGTQRIGRWYDQYDALGRVSYERNSLAPSGARTQYRYKEEGWLNSIQRFVGVGYTNPIYNETYGYDANGNRNTVSRRFIDLGLATQITSSTYSASDQMLTTQAWDGSTHLPGFDTWGYLRSYDFSTTGLEHWLDWDDEGRVREIAYATGGRSRFEYDSFGHVSRIQEIDATGISTSDCTYLWEAGKLAQIRDTQTGNLVFNYDSIGLRAWDNNGHSTRYTLLRDRLGSVIGVTNEAGQVTEEHYYDATGNEIDANGQLITRNNFAQIGYAGLLYHSRSGYYLAQHRMLDTRQGRWISRDPIGLEGGLNSFVYTDNDPINRIDRNGLDPTNPGDIEFLIGIGIGGAGWLASQYLGIRNNLSLDECVDAHNRISQLIRARQISAGLALGYLIGLADGVDTDTVNTGVASLFAAIGQHLSRDLREIFRNKAQMHRSRCQERLAEVRAGPTTSTDNDSVSRNALNWIEQHPAITIIGVATTVTAAVVVGPRVVGGIMAGGSEMAPFAGAGWLLLNR